jgi:4-diphosphocytidyl-2-C-methyl-D-erythritol kinase
VALVALGELWGLNLSMDALRAIALPLGADVPFCLCGAPARVRGIGEDITPLPPLPKLCIAIRRVGGGLSTRDVFACYDLRARAREDADIPALHAALLARDFRAVRALSRNALRAPAAELMPEIAGAIAEFYARGARFAQMSGSGSAVYGVFDDERACAKIPGAIVAVTE